MPPKSAFKVQIHVSDSEGEVGVTKVDPRDWGFEGQLNSHDEVQEFLDGLTYEVVPGPASV